MKTSLLLATLVSIAALNVSAAPQVGNQTATLNAAAAQAHHIQNLKKYGGPKANPGGIQAGGPSAGVGTVAFDGEYCGNGIKPIPGVGPVVGGGGLRGGVAMSEIERCGTRVPGRIPGVGPVGPR